MLVKDIKVGGYYFAGGVAMGKALVMSQPTRKYVGGRTFEVEVFYPDAPPTTLESRRKRIIETKDISRLWRDDDQKQFEHMQQNIENKRGWEEELRMAGFDGVVNYDRFNDDRISVSFGGLSAERVLEKLTGIEFPEEQKAYNVRS